MRHPEEWGASSLAIPIPYENDQDPINVLRGNLPISREEALSWVSEEFSAIASDVFNRLPDRVMVPETAWAIFERMAPLIQEVYNRLD